MKPLSSLHQLSNRSLLDETARLAASERNATAELIAAIAEVDARRLYLGESCSSMFTYCTRVLHLSEHAAYDRIETARLARRFPMVLEQLASGSLTLTNLRLLAPHLTAGNIEALIEGGRAQEQARGRAAHCASASAAGGAIGDSQTAPEEPASAAGGRRLCSRRTPGATSSVACGVPAPSRPAIVQPLAPERYKVQFTVSSETREKLRRVQDLMRHIIPNGDVAAIFDRALSLLLEDLEKRKVGRPSSLVARARPLLDRGIFRRASGGRSGSAMRDDALTSGHTAAVPRRASSSFITWSRTRPAVARWWRTSSCGAGLTTPTRPSCSSAGRSRPSSARPAPSGLWKLVPGPVEAIG